MSAPLVITRCVLAARGARFYHLVRGVQIILRRVLLVLDLLLNYYITIPIYTKIFVNLCANYSNIGGLLSAFLMRDEYQFNFSFYLAKHSGRQLSLQPQLGSADLNATFRAAASPPPTPAPAPAPPATPAVPRRHIIQVSTFQMCVLLLFNKRERLTYEVNTFPDSI